VQDRGRGIAGKQHGNLLICPRRPQDVQQPFNAVTVIKGYVAAGLRGLAGPVDHGLIATVAGMVER
jgi:hypothetical protein